MQTLDIDYAQQGKKWSSTWTLAFLGLAILACALIAKTYGNIHQEMNALSTNNPQQNTNFNAQSLPNLDESLALAAKVETAINKDWLAMLSHLERAQSSNPGIMLTKIQPQIGQRRLSLSGEAKRFDAITQYIQTLQGIPAFANVSLRRQSNADNNKGGILFVITMEWQS